MREEIIHGAMSKVLQKKNIDIVTWYTELGKSLTDAQRKALNDNYVIDQNNEKLRINVFKSDNKKCERCWHLNETVGTINDAPTICQRCHDNVHGDGECRIYA